MAGGAIADFTLNGSYVPSYAGPPVTARPGEVASTLRLLGYLALAIVAAGGGWLLLNGAELLGASVSLGLIITFIGYSQRFNQPIQQIAVLWTNIQNAIAGGERIFQLLKSDFHSCFLV